MIFTPPFFGVNHLRNRAGRAGRIGIVARRAAVAVGAAAAAAAARPAADLLDHDLRRQPGARARASGGGAGRPARALPTLARGSGAGRRRSTPLQSSAGRPQARG